MAFGPRTLLLMVIGVAAAAEKWGQPEEDNVVVLTGSTFADFVKEHPVVFVKFYAPWCGHCKSMAPAYSRVAERFKNEDPAVPIAKVDVTKEEKLGADYGIEGFPTLKIFINGNPINYDGGREEEEIFSYVKKLSGPASTELKTAEEVAKLQDKQKISAILVTSEALSAEDQKKWEDIARGHMNFPFGHSTHPELFEGLNASKKIHVVLDRSFDEGKLILDLDAFDAERVKEYVEAYKSPLVGLFDNELAQNIFGKEKDCVFLFTDSAEDQKFNFFRESANNQRGKITFAISEISDNLGKRLAEYIGITKENEGAIRILTFKGGLKKFPCNANKAEEVDACIEKFNKGELDAEYKSDPEPTEDDGNVKIIVGKTFEKIVLDTSKHVLLEVYAPWCGHCKALAPKYSELADLLLGHDDIVIAKMDGTTNEHSSINVEGFPTIKLFKKETNEAIDYDGGRTVKSMVEFLEKHTGKDLGSKSIKDEESNQQETQEEGEGLGNLEIDDMDLGLDDKKELIDEEDL